MWDAAAQFAPFPASFTPNSTPLAGWHRLAQPVVQWFWEALASLGPAEQRAFLKFVTSCPRPPLQGFRDLHPPLCIQKIPIQADADRLPTASTCMNLFKLPAYSSAAVMREKLVLAVAHAGGFEHS